MHTNRPILARAMASETPTPTEIFLAEVRRFASDGDVHRIFDALESHDPTPDQFSTLIAGIRVAEEMAARLAGPAAQLSGAQCLLLDARSRELAHVLGEGDAAAFHFHNLETGAVLTLRKNHPDPGGVDELIAALDGDAAHVVMLRRGARGPRDQALVFPAKALPTALAQRLHIENVGTTSCVLFLDRPQHEECTAALQPAFGFTDAETRLVWSLLETGDLQRAAGLLDVSIHTARNQLKAVYGKVGVKKQAELLLIATQLTNLHARHRDGAQQPDTSLPQKGAPEHQYLLDRTGRRVAYRRYGVAGGEPVLWFHHLERSSLLPPGAAEAAVALGLDVLCMDQPGVGNSDPGQVVSAEAFADEHLLVLNALDIEDAHFIGATRGAGLALVCAARHPTRCRSLTLAGGVPPILSSLPMGGDGNAGSHGLLQRNPWFMETYYQILGYHLQAGAGPRLLRHMPRWSQRDAAALDARPELMDYLVATSLEAGRHGNRGITDGLRIFIKAPDVDRRALPSPVHVLHSRDDQVFPLSRLSEWLGNAHQQTYLFDGYGPLLSVSEAPAILGYVRGLADNQT